MARISQLVLALALTAALGACGGDEPAPPAESLVHEPVSPTEETVAETGLAEDAKETAAVAWDRVKELYVAAKEQGETTTGDVAEWVVEDLRKVGAWDHKVVTLPMAADEVLSEQLTQLGHERWECYFVQERGMEYRMFMKRKRRSRIDLLIDRDVTRLAPVHEGPAEQDTPPDDEER